VNVDKLAVDVGGLPVEQPGAVLASPAVLHEGIESAQLGPADKRLLLSGNTVGTAPVPSDIAAKAHVAALSRMEHVGEGSPQTRVIIVLVTNPAREDRIAWGKAPVKIDGARHEQGGALDLLGEVVIVPIIELSVLGQRDPSSVSLW